MLLKLSKNDNLRAAATMATFEEQLLISCQLVKPDLIPAVQKTGIEPGDFAELANPEIQQIIVEQWHRTRSIVIGELYAELKLVLGNEIGIADLLAETIGDYCSWWHWRYFCHCVAAASYRRLLHRHAVETVDDIGNATMTFAEIEQARLDRDIERSATYRRLEAVL